MKHFRITKAMALLAMVTFLFSSCSNTSEQAKLIPANSGMVGKVNLTSIGVKAKLYDKDRFSIIDDAIEMSEGMDESTSFLVNSLLEDYSETGINVLEDMYFFASLEEGFAFSGVTIALSDATKFSNALEDALSDDYDKGGKDVEAYTYYTNESDIWIAWDDTKAVFINKIEAPSKKGEEFIEKIFNQTEETSIIANESFNNFVSNAKDVSVWISSNNIIEYFGDDKAESLLKYNLRVDDFISVKDLKDSYLVFDLLFDDNDISLTANLEPSEALSKLLEKSKYAKDKFNSDLFAFAPKENYGVFAAALSPEVLQTKIKELDEYEKVKTMAKVYDLNLDDVVKAFNGEVLLSIYDLAIDQVEKEYTRDRYNPYTNEYEPNTYTRITTQYDVKGGLIFSLSNSEIFSKILGLLEENKFVSKEGDMYKVNEQVVSSIAFASELYVGVAKDALIITTSKETSDAVANGGYSDNFSSSSVSEEIVPAGFTYINLDYATYPKSVKDYVAKGGVDEMVDNVSALLKSVSLSANSLTKATYKITLQDKDENSLYQVLETVEDTKK